MWVVLFNRLIHYNEPLSPGGSMVKVKKRSLTLIEIMVVIALIGIIGSVVGVNMKKSMDKAKAFKAKMHAQKIEDTLNMYYATSGEPISVILAKTQVILEESGLFKDTAHILVDASGKPLSIDFDAADDTFKCH